MHVQSATGRFFWLDVARRHLFGRGARSSRGGDDEATEVGVIETAHGLDLHTRSLCQRELGFWDLPHCHCATITRNEWQGCSYFWLE